MNARIASPEARFIRLHWELHRRGISGKEFAASLGVTQQYVSEIRRGHLRAGEGLRLRISELLGVPEVDLFGVGYERKFSTGGTS